MEAELEDQEANIQGVDQFLKAVDRYLDIQELTLEILHEFMECIVVYERSQPWKKKNYTQKVNIYFNYIGNLEEKAEGAPEGTPSAESQKTSLLHGSTPPRVHAFYCFSKKFLSICATCALVALAWGCRVLSS